MDEGANRTSNPSFAWLWLRTAFTLPYAIAQLLTLALAFLPIVAKWLGYPVDNHTVERLTLLVFLVSLTLFFARMVIAPRRIIEKRLADAAHAQLAKDMEREVADAKKDQSHKEALRKLEIKIESLVADNDALKKKWEAREQRQKWVDRLATFIEEGKQLQIRAEDSLELLDFGSAIQTWCRKVYNYIANYMGSSYGDQFRGGGYRAEAFEGVTIKNLSEWIRKLEGIHRDLLSEASH